MPTTAFTIDRVQIRQVFTVLQNGSRHRLEELVDLCPGLTQQQVCVAIDYLIQSGQICMVLQLTKEPCRAECRASFERLHVRYSIIQSTIPPASRSSWSVMPPPKSCVIPEPRVRPSTIVS